MSLCLCDNCGNEYDKCFTVEREGKKYNFDCFECAISLLAPRCEHCETQIIGHGVESSGHYFCCGNCASNAGFDMITDRYDKDFEESHAQDILSHESASASDLDSTPQPGSRVNH